MVLLADDHGRIHNGLVWIVAANPTPDLRWPASLEPRRYGRLGPWQQPPKPLWLAVDIVRQIHSAVQADLAALHAT